MEKEKEETILDDFDIHCVNVMADVYQANLEADNIDFIINQLGRIKLIYYSTQQKLKVMQEQVNIDNKTGLLKYNEGYLEDTMKVASRAITSSSAESNFNVSYIRLDIDDFSVFNNRYGHDIGDKALFHVAEIIRKMTRPTDYCIRFGGEEFDVLLPATHLEGAEIVAQKLIQAVAENPLKTEHGELKITVSAGISNLQSAFDDLRVIQHDDMINKYRQLQIETDHALYMAKYSGKNAYEVFSTEKLEEYKQVRKKYVKA